MIKIVRYGDKDDLNRPPRYHENGMYVLHSDIVPLLEMAERVRATHHSLFVKGCMCPLCSACWDIETRHRQESEAEAQKFSNANP